MESSSSRPRLHGQGHPSGVLIQLVRVLRGVLARNREVRVRLRADIEATIYERPGLWMNDLRLRRLQDELHGVAAAAIPGPLKYGVLLRARAPFENRLLVVARCAKTGRAVGFNALPWLAVQLSQRVVHVLHLGLLVIDPVYQRRGLQGLLYGLGAFSAYQRSRQRQLWISNVTEVPAVFGAVCEQMRDPYPHFAVAATPTDEQRTLAAALFAQHRHEFGVGAEAVFDEGRFVIQGSYSGGSDALKKSFDQAPRHRQQACNDFCRAQLDYRRGDDFLQLGLMDASVVTNWLSRRIPTDLRPALARRMNLWRYPGVTTPGQERRP